MLMLLLPPAPATAFGTGSLTLRTDSGPHSFNIEIANSGGERVLGLMYRRELAADAGMLFLYDPPQPITMWMRNTILSLDMIFIGTDGRVHRIESHTEPFSTDIISSDGTVQGVLEVNAGTANKIGLKVGYEVLLPGLRKGPKP